MIIAVSVYGLENHSELCCHVGLESRIYDMKVQRVLSAKQPQHESKIIVTMANEWKHSKFQVLMNPNEIIFVKLSTSIKVSRLYFLEMLLASKMVAHRLLTYL